MKYKNFLFAALSCLLAGTAAIASRQMSDVFAPQTVFVKAKLTAGGPTQCVSTEVTCNGGMYACCVRLNVATGPNGACSTGTYKTYQSGCTQIIFGDTQEWAISPVSVNSLVAN